MGAGPHTSVIDPTACSHGPDMRPGCDATVTDPCAGAYDRAGMAAGGNAMASHISACADPTDMSASADAVAADMGMRTDAQNIHAQLNGISRHGRQGNECKNRRGEHFHGVSFL